jgi:DNA-directed RNA polymerase subunit E'/Rpb7
MNYVNYILKKHPFSPDNMISEKPVLRELTTAIVLPAAIVGVFVNIGLVPCAVLIDLTRLVKLRRYQYIAKRRRRTYVICVLRSLDREADKYTVQLLMAA